MPVQFKKGDRVRLNESGRENLKKPHRLGTIITLGETRRMRGDLPYMAVLWDGTKQPAQIRRSFLEIASDAAPAAANS